MTGCILNIGVATWRNYSVSDGLPGEHIYQKSLGARAGHVYARTRVESLGVMLTRHTRNSRAISRGLGRYEYFSSRHNPSPF